MSKRKERVTRIIDGDTFETNRRKYPVRLEGLDTPELSQRGGKTAKKFLEGLILNREVTVDARARDKYNRAVARVKVGRHSVNKAVGDRLKK